MGSVGNKNPWATSESYRDCSQGICSIYCPQWCSYVFFPPPPPLEFSDDSSTTTFSPLIIAVIGLLASGFLLLSYYIIIAKYCRRRRNRNSTTDIEANHHNEIRHDQLVVASTGLDETLIKTITVFRYKKCDGLIEGTECAVCLNEFQENENLRLLPKCTHAFHLPCIDTWLKTHSNCPLCRSTAAPTSPPPPPPPQNSSQTSPTLNVSSLEIQRQDDLVFVIEDHERSSRGEVVVNLVTGEFLKDQIHGNVENHEMRNNVAEIDQEGVKHFRRSISLGTFSCQRNLLIADILKIEEDGEIEEEISGSGMVISSSNSSSRELESTITHEKGKNSIIPH